MVNFEVHGTAETTVEATADFVVRILVVFSSFMRWALQELGVPWTGLEP